MATATKGGSATDIAEAVGSKKRLVWFGTLPAPEPVDMRVPTRDKDPMTREYFTVKKCSPAELWMNPDDARIWIGKCRFYQSLAVRGFVFPAFSEIIERRATIETEMSATPYPGSVQIMKDDEIARIAKSCFRHVVRYKAGKNDIYGLKNTNRTEVIDLDIVRKPAGWSDEQWVAERQRIPMEIPTFDADTDIPVAEFVYMVPLDIPDFNALFDQMGVIDIGACVSYLPNKRLDREFFKSPPKSVAEMYQKPQGN